MRRVALHIGTHRTGTTSLQRFLGDHRDELRRRGVHFPVGAAFPDNHVELWFAAMRPERLRDLAPFLDWALGRLGHPLRSCQDPCWLTHARERFRAEPGDRLVYSCEGLCLLRHTDEIDRLRRVFDGVEIDVVVVHRDPHEFLDSYRWAMQVLGNRLSDDPDSPMYTEPDSWLVGYDARVALWKETLGAGRVHLIDYESCMRESGSTLPHVLEALGVELQVNESDVYHLNPRSRA